MAAAMDAVGVDGAILISPFSLYGYDPSYILGVYDQHPGKFGLVRPFDPTSDTIDDDVAQWTSTPGVVGCRVMLSNQDYEADHPGLNAIFAACARAGVPVNVMAAGKLPCSPSWPAATPTPRSSSTTSASPSPSCLRLPPSPSSTSPTSWPPPSSTTWSSRFPAPAPSPTSPSPTPTSGKPLGRIFDAYGLDRCLWGTDWTRAVRLLTYEQGVAAFRVTDRLTDSDRATLMGGTLARIYNWTQAPKPKPKWDVHLEDERERRQTIIGPRSGALCLGMSTIC